MRSPLTGPTTIALFAAGSAIGLCLTTVGPAQAAQKPAFTPASTLSTSNTWAQTPELAMMHDNRSVVAWTESAFDNAPGQVRVAIQERDGRWDRAKIATISMPNALLPSVAASGTQAVVAWAEGSPGKRVIKVSQWDGNWSFPTQVSNEGANNPQVDISSKGKVAVSYTQNDKHGDRVNVALGSEGKYTVKTVSDRNEGAVSHDTAFANEVPITTWYAIKGEYVVRAAVGNAKPTSLSAAGTHASQPQIASAGGTTMVTWQQNTNSERESIYYSTLTANSWTKPAALPEAVNAAANPAIGIDAKGQASILWIKSGSLDQGMLSRQINGTWDKAQCITDSTRDNNGEQLKVNGSGAAISGNPGIDTNVYPYRPPAQVNTCDANGDWSGVQNLSTADAKTYDVRVAINDNGHLASSWSLGDGFSNSRVDVATTFTAAARSY